VTGPRARRVRADPAAEPERRHRKFETVRKRRAIVVDVARHGPIVAETRAHRSRLRIAADVFGDVGIAEGTGLVGAVHEEKFQVGSLAANRQRLGEVGHLVEEMVPASCTSWIDGAAITRGRDHPVPVHRA
jgi:hypothetical protein